MIENKITPNPNEFIPYKERRMLGACVRRAHSSMENENTLLPETAISAFQRLLKVYKSLRPLLSFLTSFPLVPQPARSGVGLLVQLLDTVATAGPELVARFKAGRDLDPVTEEVKKAA